jgi:plasmid stabilization system protein ParE
MRYQIRITPTALSNAEEIYLWIKSGNLDAANHWFNGLFEEIDSLGLMPKRCPVAPETLLVGVEIRCLLYKKDYRILYCIEDEKVTVYHIHHAARQYLTKEKFLLDS